MPAFDVTSSPASLTLKGGEKGTFVVTATSRMSRRVTASVELAVAPKEFASWFMPVGPTQQVFPAVNATEKFTFDVSVPPGQTAVALTCTPSVVESEAPEDNYGIGSAVAITVPAGPPPPPPPPPQKFPKWVIPVVALVLIGAGIGIWLMTRGGGGEMPDVVGQQFEAADATLRKASIVVVRADSLGADTVRFPAGAVMAQSPAPKAELKNKKDSPDTARLVVQKDFVVVPADLVGVTPVDAASRLGLAGLAVRTRAVTVKAPADLNKVTSTTPAPGTLAVVGDTVTIGVGARVCPPNVICLRPRLEATAEAAIVGANRDKLGPALQKRTRRPGGN